MGRCGRVPGHFRGQFTTIEDPSLACLGSMHGHPSCYSSHWSTHLAMATCLICLARLNISTSPKFQYQIAAFSTSALRALPQPGRPDSSSRGQKTSFRKGKRKIEARGRVPSPGERKAVRKRIVLSNTNALEVDGLVDWGAVVSDSAVGTMVVIPDRLVDALRSIEAFKSGQGWGFFRRPATLIRKETMELTRHIYEHEASSGENTMRRIIIGDRGSGKSVLLLQAQSAAFEAGWVVMHFPEGITLNIFSPSPLCADKHTP